MQPFYEDRNEARRIAARCRTVCKAGLIGFGMLSMLKQPVRSAELDQVKIDGGVLRGASDMEVRVFKGVPYAAATGRTAPMESTATGLLVGGAAAGHRVRAALSAIRGSGHDRYLEVWRRARAHE